MDRRGFLGFLGGLGAFLAGVRPAPRVLPTLPPFDRQITDMVNATLRDLGKPRFADIAAGLQQHIATRAVLRQQLARIGRKVQ